MIEVSNPDRLIFPEASLTKADLVGHYARVGDRMLAFVSGRPLTLQRFPRGIDAKGFMQKNAAKHFPSSIERFAVDKRDGGSTLYPVVRRGDDLAYLANQGTVTFHMWTSTVEAPNQPDWLIIDLDPEAEDLDGVRFATLALREVLNEFGLEGFALATGSKGFHIWVRLEQARDFGDVSIATRALAGLAVARHPDRLTTEFLKKNRHGRVFVDWLRNTGLATVVVPFSLRPRPTAPVAVPVHWDEIETVRPDAWTLAQPGRLEDRMALPLDQTPRPLPVEEILTAARTAGVDLDTPHDRFGRH